MKRAILIAPLLAGCVIGSDRYQRPRDLPSGHTVDRPRVLAIRLEPPEAAPGDTVTATALFPDPLDQVDVHLWLACPPELATSIGCGVTADDGLIGMEPGRPPSLTLPDTALDGVEPNQLGSGIYWNVQVMGVPQDFITNPPTDASSLDFNQIESAYKRLVVSTNPQPNRNPDLVGFKLDDADVAPDAIMSVRAGQRYKVEIVYADDAVEDYTYTTSDGVEEQRTEEPYATWYSTAGHWANPFAMYPYGYTHWDAPTEVGVEGQLWAVVRDRRGGMGWAERAFVVAP